MTVFRQLGDPLAAAACLCQHHGAAYAEVVGTLPSAANAMVHNSFADGATIAQVQIITTERCCIVVNAALLSFGNHSPLLNEIERPVGTIRTTQKDAITITVYELLHYAAWEVLDPGTYTYHLVNRSGAGQSVYGAWIKAIASDCEG